MRTKRVHQSFEVPHRYRFRRLAKWLDKCDISIPVSTNQQYPDLPFQRWFKFKEAFSPAFIMECVRSLKRFPNSCLDPFGGSGTTALTCQFLGVRPTTIEVNPFLADLIASKLRGYDPSLLRRDFLRVVSSARKSQRDPLRMLGDAPETLVEPGRDSRWIFTRSAAQRILALRDAINSLPIESHRELLRVALGSTLVPLSNVFVNGKGRKYRGSWQGRQKFATDVDFAFRGAFSTIHADLVKFAQLERGDFTLLRGDSRVLLSKCEPADLVIFSPPYPNSFDYTDIYNLELWMLGYLKCWHENTALRRSTLRSHVQLKRDFSADELPSRKLNRVYKFFCRQREELWDRSIPEMVLAYFSDLNTVLSGVKAKLKRDGRVFIAVGNSKYAGAVIDTAGIIRELAPALGFSSFHAKPMRSMRSSAQQGGRRELTESLVVLG